MISLLALFPACFIVVASDAPNPEAVVIHEMAHCWGYRHAEKKGDPNKVLNKAYRANMPSRYWTSKGEYPNLPDGIHFETSKEVLKLCDGGSAYGCQWGGLSSD